MLLWLSYHAVTWWPLPLRALLAAIVCFVLSIAIGPRAIAWLRARFREPARILTSGTGRPPNGWQYLPRQ